MRTGLDPFSFLIVSIAGCMDQHQQRVVEYLIEENRVLRVKEQMGHHSIQVTVDIYGHLIQGSNKQAVDRLDQVPAVAPATA